MPDTAGPGNAVAGLAFMVAFGEAFNIVSALNSSPWTAENFGGDPAKEASVRKWVHQSIGICAALGTVGSVMTRSWAPLIGTMAADLYVYWCYDTALKRARGSASVGWASPGSMGKLKAWDWKASK